jgi:hypothetical protein
MRKRDQLGNLDLTRVTLIGWLVTLISGAVGVGGIALVDSLLSAGNAAKGAPPPGANRTSLPVLVGFGAAVGFFLLCKFVLNAFGILLIRREAIQDNLTGKGAGEVSNEATLADLRRRRANRGLGFWIFVILIPAGCGGVISLSYIPKTPDAVKIIVGAAFPLVGVVGALLVGKDYLSCRRLLALAGEANRQGLHFIEHPDEERYVGLRSLKAIANADNMEASNMLTGEIEGQRITAFTAQLEFGHGRGATFRLLDVIVLHDAVPGVPSLLLCPRETTVWLAENVMALARKGSIELSGQREFNRRFALLGEDQKATAAHFTPKVVALCLREDLVVEIQRGLLAAYWDRKPIKPEDYSRMIRWAVELAKALRSPA